MSGMSLDAARVALDEGAGRPCRLLWSPVSLAVLYQARVNTWQFGPPRGPSALPSRWWPRAVFTAVFTAVVSALAEALLRDLAAREGGAGTEGASA